MSKTIFIIVALTLSVNAWDLKILSPVINGNTTPVFAFIWLLAGYIWFIPENGYYRELQRKNLNKHFFWLVIGFTLSFFTAWFFWGQDLITSVIVNRRLVFFLFIPLFFYIQPAEREIIKSLEFYTICYMCVWLAQAISPNPVTTYIETAVDAGRGVFALDETDFGYLIQGYAFMLILLYYKIQKFIEDVSFRAFIPVIMMMGIFFLLQNRGALFFAVVVFGFSFFMIKTKYKYFFILLLGALMVGAYIVTARYWSSFIAETTSQLEDPTYNRWKALNFFIFQYPPHWLCYIFGNGYLSARIDSGQYLMTMMSEGFYQADLGIIGFWSMYGVIPVLVIYSIVFRILFNGGSPFYLKAIAFHILFVPIAWGFSYYDMLLLVTLNYLSEYYSPAYKKSRLQLKYNYLK
jgi:hypothetical protein